ncbi:MAG: hypothetical protein V4654_08920 [Bdellovibrionota bacterium]
MKYIFKKLFAKKNVREAVDILNEFGEKFQKPRFGNERLAANMFVDIKNMMLKNLIYKDEQNINSLSSKDVRSFVYFNIAKVFRIMMLNNHYSMAFRIPEMSENLFRIYDSAIDELVELGNFNQQEANESKLKIRADNQVYR